MDLDAMHRHMTEFKTMKPRLLKMLEFVEGIMASGMMPTPKAPDTTDTSSAIVTVEQLGTLRQDLTGLDDRMDVLDKFKDDVLPVLEQVPQFLALMEKMQGFDPVSIEERLTTVEGGVQEIAAALDPKGEDLPTASGIEPGAASSDGATPGQGDDAGEVEQDGATKAPASDAAAPAVS